MVRIREADVETTACHRPPGETVCVERFGQAVQVTPSCPEITEVLSTRVRRAVHDDQHGCRIATALEPLLVAPEPPRWPHPDQRLPIATAGLEPIVTHMAKEAGYKIERRWYSPPPSPLPEPNLAAPRWSGTCDEHVLRFVCDRERGLIRYTPGTVDLLRLITEIALAFPGATMAAMAATNKAAKRAHDRLHRLLPGVTWATAKQCPPDPGRIVVGTFFAFGHGQIECEKRNIVFILDAVEAIAEQGQMVMGMTDAKFRLFGFLPVDRKLSAYDHDRTIAMFGLNEVTVPQHGHQPIQVSVAWTPVHAPALPEDTGLLTLKRRGIWKQHQRNRQIARLAKAIASNDQSFLAEKHSSVARALNGKEAPRVMVLVEGADHALSLAAHLPRWPLLTGPEVITDGLSPEHRRRLDQQRRKWLVGPPFIVTASGLEGVDFTKVDVILWGGGGGYLPPLPRDQLISPAGEDHRLLIVDIVDRHSPRLYRWCQRRRRAYSEIGWWPAGRNPLVARIQHFLATRPRRRK
ncbi:hypothetical protein ACFL5Q_02245 [Planctomycetota bacterium]